MKLTRIGTMALAMSALLTGCAQAPKPLYAWGSFPAQQYAYLKGDTLAPQIEAMEKMREEARSKDEKLPPGFRAHLGLLYGKAGQDDRMVEQLVDEKSTFHEASAYIDFLLARIKKP